MKKKKKKKKKKSFGSHKTKQRIKKLYSIGLDEKVIFDDKASLLKIFFRYLLGYLSLSLFFSLNKEYLTPTKRRQCETDMEGTRSLCVYSHRNQFYLSKVLSHVSLC